MKYLFQLARLFFVYLFASVKFHSHLSFILRSIYLWFCLASTLLVGFKTVVNLRCLLFSLALPGFCGRYANVCKGMQRGIDMKNTITVEGSTAMHSNAISGWAGWILLRKLCLLIIENKMLEVSKENSRRFLLYMAALTDSQGERLYTIQVRNRKASSTLILLQLLNFWHAE